MPNTKNKQKNESFIFDLLEKNLPKQESDEEERPISSIECFLWMIGIIVGIFFLQYIFKLLF
jgi:beta-lactamase regulating signal transducer with metallopeptidase domain